LPLLDFHSKNPYDVPKQWTTRESDMGQIYLCYSKHDQETGERLAQALREAGLEIWQAPEDAQSGGPWRVAVVKAIDACPAFVLVLSRPSAEDDDVRRQIDLAYESGREILGILLEQFRLPAEIRYQLAGLQFVDAQTLGREDAERILVERVREQVGQAGT
jgi:hypothetical protein